MHAFVLQSLCCFLLWTIAGAIPTSSAGRNEAQIQPRQVISAHSFSASLRSLGNMLKAMHNHPASNLVDLRTIYKQGKNGMYITKQTAEFYHNERERLAHIISRTATDGSAWPTQPSVEQTFFRAPYKEIDMRLISPDIPPPEQIMQEAGCTGIWSEAILRLASLPFGTTESELVYEIPRYDGHHKVFARINNAVAHRVLLKPYSDPASHWATCRAILKPNGIPASSTQFMPG